MPRTYAHNRGARRNNGTGSALSAVRTSQRQAANPYRMHTGDPLVSGVSNLAAALFRAPVERAQIEDQRSARQQAQQYQQERDAKDDLFREKQLQTQHEDAQAKIAAKAAGAKPAGQTGPKMGTIPAFVHESRIDPATMKPVFTQRPLNDAEMSAALKNQQRTQAVGALAAGTNPDNGKPLGKDNPYQIPLPTPQQQMAEQDALFGGGHAAQAQQAAAKPAPAPVGGMPTPAGAAAPVGGLPQRDPHAVLDPSMFPQGMLDAAYPGGPQQAQQVSQQVAALHPEDQAQYGKILGAFTQAYQSGDKTAIQAASANLQTANSRLLGQQPAVVTPLPADAPAPAGSVHLGMYPSNG